MAEPTADTALIDAYLDGTIDEPRFAALRTWLAADPAHARLFAERSLLHRHSTELAQSARPASSKPDLSPPRAKVRVSGVAGAPGVPSSQSRVPRFAYALAATLLLAAAAVAIYVFALNPDTQTPPPNTDPVATVTDTTGGGTLIVNDDVVEPGQTITGGSVSLDTGTADFRLNNGVEIRVHGATELTVHDELHVTLTRGSAAFDCPHTAKGYAVDLPGGARVVDLGTAFRVWVNESGVGVVSVREGRVAVHHGGQTVEVAAGRGARIEADGSIVAVASVDDLAALAGAPLVFDLRPELAATFGSSDAVAAWGPFEQSDPAHQPTIVSDDPAGPLVRFDGVDDFFAADPVARGDNLTLTAVLRRRGDASHDDERQLYNGPLVATLTTDDALEAWSYVDRAKRGHTVSPVIAPDRWVVVTYVYDAAAKRARLYVDGRSVAESDADTPPRRAARQFVGTQNGLREYFAGDVRRLVLHAAALDDDAVLDLHARLAVDADTK